VKSTTQNLNNSGLLREEAVQIGKLLPTSWRTFLPPSSGSKESTLLVLNFFYPHVDIYQSTRHHNQEDVISTVATTSNLAPTICITGNWCNGKTEHLVVQRENIRCWGTAKTSQCQLRYWTWQDTQHCQSLVIQTLAWASTLHKNCNGGCAL
jgi:hypothetical protein